MGKESATLPKRPHTACASHRVLSVPLKVLPVASLERGAGQGRPQFNKALHTCAS